MKIADATRFDSRKHLALFISLLFVGLVALPASIKAVEDPPGCSLSNGGAGSGHQGGIHFNFAQAHLGDTVRVFPSLGMVNKACRVINVTGTVYIATGPLTNFLQNAVLEPGELVSCPAFGICQPGPYNILITPALIAAPVNTPLGDVAGVAKTVRAVENASGRIMNDIEEPLLEFGGDSIGIVTPGLQVSKTCDFPPGQSCFPAGEAIRFTGYVTNCGDIRLTNVTVLDSRDPALLALNGLPLFQPLTLDPGQAVGFQGRFAPTLAETFAGSAASAVTVCGTDITTIGGSNASVTNQAALSSAICDVNPVLDAPAYTNGQFQFTVASQLALNCVIQVCTNLGGTNWLSICTNAAPFTFVESNAVFYPARFYRAMFLP